MGPRNITFPSGPMLNVTKNRIWPFRTQISLYNIECNTSVVMLVFDDRSNSQRVTFTWHCHILIWLKELCMFLKYLEKRQKNNAFELEARSKIKIFSASFEFNTKTHQSLSSIGLRKLKQDSVSVLISSVQLQSLNWN